MPAQLLHRKPSAQKKDFGHVLIVAGSARFSGAAVLCAHAAMRCGAGLVTLGVPKSLNSAFIKVKPSEVMTLPLPDTAEATLGGAAEKKIRDFTEKADVVIVGPGLSLNASTLGLVRRLVKKIAKPLVIDADGLNALVGHLDLLRGTRYVRGMTIITPHPGEMARLLGVSVENVQRQRKDIAIRFSKHYNCITVLKGHKTVVAGPLGTVHFNTTGNPGMATAGSGDVLAGMIAAFIGQGLEAFEAARCAVYVHGLAGDIAAKEKTEISLIASDIIDAIPKAIKRCS